MYVASIFSTWFSLFFGILSAIEMQTFSLYMIISIIRAIEMDNSFYQQLIITLNIVWLLMKFYLSIYTSSVHFFIIHNF